MNSEDQKQDPKQETQTKDRFAAAGELAVKRLNAVHCFRCLKASALPLCGGGLIAILAMRYLGVRWPDWIVALAIIGVWFGFAAVWAIFRRPTRFAALAAWDEKAGRKEALASAEFFESRGDLTEGEKLHLLRSGRILEEAQPALKKDLPLPSMTWQWALPLMVLAFSFSPWLKPQLGADDRPISADVSAVAREEADRLKREIADLKKAEGLTAEEEQKYEEVVKEARDMASDQLEKAGDKTTREILKELEERARAAEKLAKELGGDDDKWASDQMLAEMGKHADMADLADAIKDKNATKSAHAARVIRDALKSDKLTKEVEGRLDKALEKTAEKADSEDLKKPVGKHVKTASRRLKAKKKRDAGDEMEKLAKELDRKAQRERAKKQMEKLAKSLRNTGSKIAGKNMAGMKKLAGNKRRGLKKMQKAPLGFHDNPHMEKLGKSDAMRMKDLPMMKMPKGMKMGKGTGKPLAMAPVPGMKPGGKPKSMIPGMGSKPGAGAGAPIPIPGMGAAAGGPGAMQGGLQAGHGSAQLGKGKTKPRDAKKNSTVVAKMNSEGEVTMRAVEGQDRGEMASRKASSERIDFVNIQEEALDEATLPSARRAHVRRYFHLLREQFEAADAEAE